MIALRGLRLVELLAWSACVHLLEAFVERVYFVSCQSGVFRDACGVFCHVGIFVYVLCHGLSGLSGGVGHLSEWGVSSSILRVVIIEMKILGVGRRTAEVVIFSSFLKKWARNFGVNQKVCNFAPRKWIARPAVG